MKTADQVLNEVMDASPYRSTFGVSRPFVLKAMLAYAALQKNPDTPILTPLEIYTYEELKEVMTQKYKDKMTQGDTYTIILKSGTSFEIESDLGNQMAKCFYNSKSGWTRMTEAQDDVPTGKFTIALSEIAFIGKTSLLFNLKTRNYE